MGSIVLMSFPNNWNGASGGIPGSYGNNCAYDIVKGI